MKHTRTKKSASRDIGQIGELLDQIDPDLHYGDWVRVLMAIFNETHGNEEGFELADAWCSRGQKYPGSRDIRSKWNSFRIDQEKPVTIGTLIWMARQA